MLYEMNTSCAAHAIGFRARAWTTLDGGLCFGGDATLGGEFPELCGRVRGRDLRLRERDPFISADEIRGARAGRISLGNLFHETMSGT